MVEDLFSEWFFETAPEAGTGLLIAVIITLTVVVLSIGIIAIPVIFGGKYSKRSFIIYCIAALAAVIGAVCLIVVEENSRDDKAEELSALIASPETVEACYSEVTSALDSASMPFFTEEEVKQASRTVAATSSFVFLGEAQKIDFSTDKVTYNGDYDTIVYVSSWNKPGYYLDCYKILKNNSETKDNIDNINKLIEAAYLLDEGLPPRVVS